MAAPRRSGRYARAQGALPLRYRAQDVQPCHLRLAWQASAFPSLRLSFDECMQSPDLLAALKLLALAMLNRGRLH